MNKDLTIEQQVILDCPLLFRMYGRPYNETCISFGFECNNGWHNAIANACRELEVWNNMFYDKYRVCIQADQIKEKFGTCCFYWSVVVDPCDLITKLARKLEYVYDELSNFDRFDYKLKQIVDIEPYDYDDITEISKEKYNEKVNSKFKASNVEFKEDNGKYFEVCHLRNYGKSHFEPTQHKFLWKLRQFCNNARNFLMYKFPKKDSSEVRNCIEFLDRKAHDIIKNLEHECGHLCEFCGTHIGTDWSPVCQTTGWIRYLCDECAKKSSSSYYKNGDLWYGDKLLKNKEEKDGEKNLSHEKEN